MEKTPEDYCAKKPDGFTSKAGQCQEFVLCLDHVVYDFECPYGLRFNDTLKYCVNDLESSCVLKEQELKVKLPKELVAVEDSSSEPKDTADVKESPDKYLCPADGYFRDLTDCATFYNCDGGIAHKFSCPDGLFFNELRTACDRPENVQC
ncbi:unnamed protein product [Soboliphyme baturini]|uniref:Chitin-binding type-2 domain-containing protein n=1 Tax=Soboliphyme baturini TaxID=241478 RepID=A0A183I8W8_9BILA|nr:unnamed protein product [Soboliphyme baturini]